MNNYVKYCKRCGNGFEGENKICQECLGEESFEINKGGVEWE